MATPNGLNPNFNRVSINGGAVLLGGQSSSAAVILAEVGKQPASSLYFVTTNGKGSSAIWYSDGAVWTLWTQP